MPPEVLSSLVVFRESPPRCQVNSREINDHGGLYLNVELKTAMGLNLWENAIIKISKYKKPMSLVSKIKHIYINNFV